MWGALNDHPKRAKKGLTCQVKCLVKIYGGVELAYVACWEGNTKKVNDEVGFTVTISDYNILLCIRHWT